MANKKKVLILDDEPHVVTYLEMLLQDHGYDTDSAPNGRVGLEKVRQEIPDLICLDITMPEESGIGFYRNLKDDSRFANIPVVVVTAVTGTGGDPDPFKQFLSTRKKIPPPEGFFSKPIDQKEFLEAISSLLS